MTKKKVLVLTDHMPWGHRAIARAIYGYLKDKEGEGRVKVDFVQVRAEVGPANEIYTFLCRHLPRTHRLVHRVASVMAESRMEIFEEISRRSLLGLKKAVNWYKPDLIISAYFLHSHCLDWWRRNGGGQFELWTVVADPRTINPVSFVPGADLNLVYDEVGIEKGLRLGVEREKLLATGWWTREKMYQKHDRRLIRKKLGFNDDRPVVFVGGGSLGTSSITRILPALMMVKKKVGMVFNSGTDKLVFNLVNEYGRLFRKLKRDNLVQIKNLGWVENMDEVLAACDMVFGKAGPNFLFDVVAAKKPFVAVTHIGGQEDGNIDLIREKKLGWVKEKNGEISEFLLSYIKRPRWYERRFARSIATEAKRNRGSLEKIYKKILPKG